MAAEAHPAAGGSKLHYSLPSGMTSSRWLSQFNNCHAVHDRIVCRGSAISVVWIAGLKVSGTSIKEKRGVR